MKNHTLLFASWSLFRKFTRLMLISFHNRFSSNSQHTQCVCVCGWLVYLWLVVTVVVVVVDFSRVFRVLLSYSFSLSLSRIPRQIHHHYPCNNNIVIDINKNISYHQQRIKILIMTIIMFFSSAVSTKVIQSDVTDNQTPFLPHSSHSPANQPVSNNVLCLSM